MATRTIANGGGNWGDTSTWVEGAVPTNSDDVVATATSGNLVVNSATCTCATIDLTGYTGQLTIDGTNKLIVVTTTKFVAGMTVAGSGTLKINNTATITSGGLTLPWAINFDAGTFTLADNWTTTGTVSFTSGQNTLNGNALSCAGLTLTQACNGTTNITITGGTWSGAGNLKNNLTFAGNVTVSGTVTRETGTTTYTSGTITTTDSTLNINGDCTMNTNGMTWNIVRAAFSTTVALGSNLQCNYLTNAVTRSITFTGAYDVTCGTLNIYSGGGVTLAASQTLTVTAALIINGQKPYTGSYNTSIQSGTASTHIHLVYSGTAANCQAYFANMIDVDATGSAQAIDVWYPEALTRCTNINSRTSADIGGASTPGWFAGE